MIVTGSGLILFVSFFIPALSGIFDNTLHHSSTPPPNPHYPIVNSQYSIVNIQSPRAFRTIWAISLLTTGFIAKALIPIALSAKARKSNVVISYKKQAIMAGASSKPREIWVRYSSGTVGLSLCAQLYDDNPRFLEAMRS